MSLTSSNSSSKFSLFSKMTSFLITITFLGTLLTPPQSAFAQLASTLPSPGVMVKPSVGYQPLLVQGMTIHPDNPLLFDFYISKGDSDINDSQVQEESQKLIKYFLAALTVPEEDMWVNLSPYEEDRIINYSLAQTDLGKDLLGQDYILKQITASLVYPEDAAGQKYWQRIYQRVQQELGRTDVHFDTFNKIWVVPERAEVYEDGSHAIILDSHLKVMMEQDYLALDKNKESSVSDDASTAAQKTINISAEELRNVIIPIIEDEVNNGQNFANLRQVYHSMILATWYKQRLKNSLLGQLYADQAKVGGIDIENSQGVVDGIYNQYLEAFKIGVYDYIREDVDAQTNEVILRKYFSGGFMGTVSSAITFITPGSDPLGKLARWFREKREKTNDVIAAQWQAVDIGNNAKTLDIKKLAKIRIPNTARVGFRNMSRMSRALVLVASVLPTFFLSSQDVNAEASPRLLQFINSPGMSVADGFARSFRAPIRGDSFWEDVVTNPGEKAPLNTGLSIYDLATLMRVLNHAGRDDTVDRYINMLNSDKWGTFRLRDTGNGLFTHMITPLFIQPDPAGGGQIQWPIWDRILGANAWLMLASFQDAYYEAKGNIEEAKQTESYRLAMSIFLELETLISSNGAGSMMSGTDIVSVENNISLLAMLRVMHQLTEDPAIGARVDALEKFLKEDAFDRSTGIFKTGGTGGVLNDLNFAADTQTWAMLVLTPKVIDQWFGSGTAYNMWIEVKERSGYLDGARNLLGIGYSRGSVLSGEWTAGAIAATLELYTFLKDRNPNQAKEVLADALSMRIGLETLSVSNDLSSGKGYLYANKRVRIVFDWFSNKLPSLVSTTWTYFIDSGINPFTLEGETQWMSIGPFKNLVDRINRGENVLKDLKKQSIGSRVLERVSSLAPSEDKEGRLAYRLLQRINTTNPTDAEGSKPYKELIRRGFSNLPELKAFVQDIEQDTDQRKWALRAFGPIALQGSLTDEQIQDIIDFLKSVISDGSGLYAEWHKVEAEKAMKDVQEASSSVGQEKTSPQVVESSASTGIRVTGQPEYGGIDLDAKLLDLQIKRDSNGVPLPMSMQPIGDMKIQGIVPVIINITPVPNLPVLLGILNVDSSNDLALPLDKNDESSKLRFKQLSAVLRYDVNCLI